jgi:Family of unknown function (DUF6876)
VSWGPAGPLGTMETPKHVDDLELKELGSFIGTEQYHRGFLGVNCTDGVKYVMENGYTWFVNDAVAVLKTMPKFRNEPFVVVRLNLHDPPYEVYDPESDSDIKSVATLVMDDGNNNPLYHQEYQATDAKVNLKLYFADNVMMLASEY